MVNNHCLSVDEIDLLYKIEIEKYIIPDDEDYHIALFSNWNDWGTNFVCLNYLLARFLEKKNETSQDIVEVLDNLIQLPSRRGLGLEFDEMDEAFVSYLFRYWRDSGLSLEDNLRKVRNYQADYKY